MRNTKRRVLNAIRYFAGGTGKAKVSQAAIAEKARVAQSCITPAVRRLVSEGRVQIVAPGDRRFHRGRVVATRYQLA